MESAPIRMSDVTILDVDDSTLKLLKQPELLEVLDRLIEGHDHEQNCETV